MKTPPIVTAQEWEAARQQLLVKEKELTRARDALAAERRRMPWLAVEKDYEFGGPEATASLLDLFEGRRQLVVYRAFFEPGVDGWPGHACRGCSLVADQVAHVAHLNARDTTLIFVSRAPQPDIAWVKARIPELDLMPWYTITDDFDADFGVDEGGTARTRSSATGDQGCSAPTSSTAAATRRWGAPGATSTSQRSGRQEQWEDSPASYPQTPPLRVVELARRIQRHSAKPSGGAPRSSAEIQAGQARRRP